MPNLLHIKRVADGVQSKTRDLAEASEKDVDLKDLALSVELAIGAYQAELEERLQSEGIEAPETKPLKPKPKIEDFPQNVRVKVVGKSRPQFLSENGVEGTVVGHGRTKVLVQVDDVETARRFRNRRMSIPPTLLERV